MKQIILSLVITLISIVAKAQMDVPMGGGNIKATISERAVVAGISTKYWRPGVKGRVIFEICEQSKFLLITVRVFRIR
jgi:hypothetical protein